MPFNPCYILSDADIYGFDKDFDVNRFLKKHKSPLLTWRSPEGKTAAQVITETCEKKDINPRIILVTLQKEQSLISKAPSSPKAMDWALGFGCYDNGTRVERHRGFQNQIIAACSRFQEYTKSNRFRIKKSFRVDHIAPNKQYVNPVNMATVACYLYTPWRGTNGYGKYKVPFGNYLLWQVWCRFFGEPAAKIEVKKKA